MKISTVIKRLEAIKKKYGDLEFGYRYGYGYKDNLDGTTDIVFATALYLEECEIELRKAIESYYLVPFYA